MTVKPSHPLIPERPVDPRQELPQLELQVLRRWKERDVFQQSLREREGSERWVFYEGPPTANGRPGSHHVLSRVFKDIYPRYKTMKGFRVDRKGGWDCHGLPVEIAVEQQLGLKSKAEIEKYGIKAFNEKCRESVFTYLEDWNRLTERIGFWLDLDDAYRTLDESYVESVWWALSEIASNGLLYEGHKVVPYCPRCGTALSSHEVALGYKDVTDQSVYVRLKLLDSDESLLIWTTTPWTLPGNVAVAVGPSIEYAKVRWHEETLILASARVEEVLGDEAEVLETMLGSDLAKRRYHGPLFGVRPQASATAPLWSILEGDFVTTEDGTGLVHLAPAFGEDDFSVAAEAGLIDRDDPDTLLNPVRLDGTYGPGVIGAEGRSYEGRFVKDEQLTEELIADLESRSLLLKRTDYEHSYPHCWRCGTPLIYYAKASWYIKTTALREEMLAANETVSWHPAHIKQGRFGEWLKGNVDWALSRERYWGTPLPVWRCEHRHTKVIGSFAELERLSGTSLNDHHRPYVDEVEIACEARDSEGNPCDAPMKRVPEVIDVWFDSGAMPFAQHHAPFENAKHFKERFPADFICEALDQTRGWFYSLLAVTTLISGSDLLSDTSERPEGASPTRDRSEGAQAGGGSKGAQAGGGFEGAPYRNVVCLGLILDAEGQKMSKSKGNTVEPWQVLDDHGADAFRWYFFTSKQPWDGYRFSEEAIGEGVRLFLKQLWSTYFFYVLYANANADQLREVGLSAVGMSLDGVLGADASSRERSWADASSRERSRHHAELDRWVLSRTAATAQRVSERLDAYDATSAGREIAELVDDVSNWYVRRSRRRFWDGDAAAFSTLRQCLLTVSKLLAPFCPFIADEIYDNLDGSLPSVHLCDFPAAGDLPERDVELEEAMATARQTVKLGLGARGKAKVKVRQPLSEAVIVADGREREAIQRLSEIVREELNVREVRFVDAAEELGRYEVKANYRRLGPIFGKDMPLVAKAIAALDPQHVASTVLSAQDGMRIGISVSGREHELSSDDLIVTMSAPEGYSVEREGAHAVALELTIDEDLKREGYAREVVHAVQNARKNAGLDVEDRIALALSGDAELLIAAEAHKDYVAGETLAVRMDANEPSGGERESRGEREPGGERGGERESLTQHAHRETAKIDGLPLTIELSRAARA